jgi:adenylate cyclase
VVIGLLASVCPAHLAVPLVALLSGGYAYTALQLFGESSLWIPLAVPMLVQVPFALLVGLLAQYLLERRQRQRYSAAVSYYVPEAVARQLVDSAFAPSEANSVVYATCFATDMAGFTPLGESMEAGELARFMNDYFEALAEPLRSHGVDVTEFRADAIMCAWTASEESTELRLRAASAALDMVEAVAAFSARKAHPLPVRIGLEVGWVYVGHAGGGGHFVYSIVGDAANTAARVEGLNKRFGTSILATDEVVQGLDALLLRPLGRFVLVGKQSPSPISEIVAYRSLATDTQRDLCDRFAGALQAFNDRDWKTAAERFADVIKQHPDDGPARLYLERASAYVEVAPALEDPTAVILDSK